MLVGNRIRQNLLTHTRFWYLIDAKDQINGRLAAYAATILQGKTKPIWHPKVDVGDFLVIINTKKVAFTGKKWDRKVYRHHTGYPGGFKEKNAISLHQKDSTRVLWRAINGMLPKTKTESCTCHVYFYLRMKIILMQKNIYSQLKSPASLPRRLDEYTKEELDNYPKLLLDN